MSGSEVILYRAVGPNFGTMEVCLDLVCQTVSNTTIDTVSPAEPFTLALSPGVHDVEVRAGENSDVRLYRVEVRDAAVATPTPLVIEVTTTPLPATATPTETATVTHTAAPTLTATPMPGVGIVPAITAIASVAAPTEEIPAAPATDNNDGAFNSNISPFAQINPGIEIGSGNIPNIWLNQGGGGGGANPAMQDRQIIYQYDKLWRMTSADYYENGSFTSDVNFRNSLYTGGTLTHDYNYGFDLFGNMVNEQHNNGYVFQRFYDKANRLRYFEGQSPHQYQGAYNLYYDANGNVTEIWMGEVPYALLTYDAANRLTEHAPTTYTPWHRPPISSFTYNGFGDRVSQTVNGVTTEYLLDMNSGLTQVLGEFTTPGSENYYLLGLDVIGQYSSTSNWQYFGYDGLGSVRQMTNANGQLSHSAIYSPYGVPLATGGMDTSLGFTGEQSDASGLLYLRARYYDPALGTFLTKDPVVGVPGYSQTFNAYSYVRNNPANLTDPSGEFVPLLLGIAVVAGVGAAAWDFFVTKGHGLGGHNAGKSASLCEITDSVSIGVKTAIATAFAGFAALGATTAFGTSLAALAVAGAVGGQGYLIADNVVNGRNVTDGVGNPGDMVRDAVLGLVIGGFAKVIGSALNRFARPLGQWLSNQPFVQQFRAWDERITASVSRSLNRIGSQVSTFARNWFIGDDRVALNAWYNRIQTASDDVVILAQEAAENYQGITRAQGRPAKVTVGQNYRTGDLYYGETGSLDRPVHPVLQQSGNNILANNAGQSMMPWDDIFHCAECNVINEALWNGASVDDIIMATFNTPSAVNPQILPAPRCLNCQITSAGAIVPTD